MPDANPGYKKTHLAREFPLSFNWRHFDRQVWLFSRLKYPAKLVNSTISQFAAAKTLDQPASLPTINNQSDRIRVILPFIDQASANVVRV